MYHCHIIEHEDGGMMAQIETFDPAKPKQEYKEEIEGLKSLMVPVREDEKDPIAQQSKDINKIKEEPQKKIKNGGILEECESI